MPPIRIDAIELNSFKGVTDKMQIGALNLLIGPNGSGKSARLEAVEYAIRGRTKLGGRLDDTAALAGLDGRCSVAIVLADGRYWSRSISKDHLKSKLSESVATSGGGKMSAKQAQAYIDQGIGNFAPVFDMREFLSLSPDRRRQFIMELCSDAIPSKVDADHVMDQVSFLTLGEKIGGATVRNYLAAVHRLDFDTILWDPNNSEKLRATCHALWSNQSTADQDAKDKILAELRRELADANLPPVASMLGVASDLVNQSRRDKDRAYALAQECAAEKNKLRVVSGTVQALKEERNKLADERSEIQKQLANQEGRASSLESLERQIDDRIKDCQNLHSAIDALREQREAAQANLSNANGLERQADAILDKYREAISLRINPAIEKAADRANEAAQKANDVLIRANYRLESSQANHSAALNLVKAAKSNDWTALEANCRTLENRIKILTEMPEWCEIRRIVGVHVGSTGDLEAAEKAAEDCRLRLEEAENDVISAKEDHRSAERAKSEANRALAKAKEEYMDAASEAQALANQANELRKEAESIRQEVANIDRLIETNSESLKKAESANVSAQKERNELLSAGGHVATESLEAQIEALGEAIGKLDDQIDSKIRLAALEEQMAKSQAGAESLACFHEMAKLVSLALRGMRERMMARMVEPLLGRMRKFLEVAAPGHEPYCRLENDRGTAIFEMGWAVESPIGIQQIEMRAMSGGEKCIFYAALAYALVCLANPPLKLLMIEAAELDDEHSGRLIDACHAISDELSNVLIATCNKSIVVPGDEWSIFALDKKALVEA